jgi:hypothetical protein
MTEAEMTDAVMIAAGFKRRKCLVGGLNRLRLPESELWVVKATLIHKTDSHQNRYEYLHPNVHGENDKLIDKLIDAKKAHIAKFAIPLDIPPPSPAPSISMDASESQPELLLTEEEQQLLQNCEAFLDGDSAMREAEAAVHE